MLVGITGGIGSGKSTIAAELIRRGFPVYDTDREAKHIIIHNPAVRSQIETLFGSEVFDGDVYQTAKVAEQVFANPDLLHKLNAIVHPAVTFDLRHWQKDKELCFVESALLFESGLDALCDRIVYIDAPEEIRIMRTIARDHCTAEQVRARIRTQNDKPQTTNYKQPITLINDGEVLVSDLVDSLLQQLNAPAQ